MTTNTYGIQPMMKFMLIFRPLASIVLIGFGIFIIADPDLDLTYGPVALLAIGGFAAYEISKLVKWYEFTVSVDDEQIAIGGTSIPWGEITSAKAVSAQQFSTFITIISADGKEHSIPGAIQESAYILTMVKKHFPGLTTE
ncbi:MAG: hypothetical protein IPO60_07055 [Flavobacteriales bacterium]|nr:hypothetical protein [Flavobacteriales bacterium]